jgi:hypothetical protein
LRFPSEIKTETNVKIEYITERSPHDEYPSICPRPVKLCSDQ